MTPIPIFSVIIPTYNTGKVICKTLDSLVAQTFKNFEVIISDDGSTDNTLQYAKEYTSKLNLTIIANGNWGGPARPRNLGIRASSALWIAFLDHDDFWYENKLEEILKYTESNDVIFHDLCIYNNQGKTKRVAKGREVKPFPFVNLMTLGNAIPNSSSVVRKSLLAEVNYIDESRELVTVEDYDLWLKIALKTNRFYYRRKALGGYFLEPGQNLSSASEKKIQHFSYIHQKYESLLSKEDKGKSIAYLCYAKARVYHHLQDLIKAELNYKITLSSGKGVLKVKALAGLVLLNFKKLSK